MTTQLDRIEAMLAQLLGDGACENQAAAPRAATATSEALLANVISSYLETKRAEVTPQHHQNLVLNLSKFLNSTKLGTRAHEVTPLDVLGYRTSMVRAGRSVGTINQHMACLRAFFTWAIRMHYCTENPAAGSKLKQHGAPSGQRSAFSDEQIERIFSHEVLRGRISAKGWLPLIMLHTGARPEEIAQLRVGDVHEITQDGQKFWVFDFTTTGDGQRHKNEASKRVVPIHPKLWELGLNALLGNGTASDGHRDTEALLFPELTGGHNGRLAEAPSRWFNRQLRAHWGISDPKLVLYSLRHTVATKLKHTGHNTEIIEQLLGHTTHSQSTGRYGKEYPLVQLQAAVAHLGVTHNPA